MAASPGRLPPEAVREMFDRITPVYDAMNRAMTLGLDQKWRRLTAEAVVRPGDRVLDACCGTGDLALACARAGGRVTGLDFAARMLGRAREKAPGLEWVQGDLLALPFEDATFDAATVGFGVRNVADLEAAFGELARVLKPGGRLGCLEITQPTGSPAAVLRPLVRSSRPARGQVASRRKRLQLPACERPAVPRASRTRGDLCGRRLLPDTLEDGGRRYRRSPYGHEDTAA